MPCLSKAEHFRRCTEAKNNAINTGHSHFHDHSIKGPQANKNWVSTRVLRVRHQCWDGKCNGSLAFYVHLHGLRGDCHVLAQPAHSCRTSPCGCAFCAPVSWFRRSFCLVHGRIADVARVEALELRLWSADRGTHLQATRITPLTHTHS